MTLAEDRRKKRSDDPLVALHHHLSCARNECKLDAIVVADDAGLVVAGVGSWAACEELAAYAPLLVQSWPEAAASPPSRVAEMRANVDVAPVNVNGQTVLLCVRGKAQLAAMERTARGVARILRNAT